MRKHGTVRTTIISAIAALAIGLPAASANAQPATRGTPVHLAASSVPYEICNVYKNSGALDECLNNWNGADGYVKSYAPGVTNNSFIVEGVDRCGNGDYTTSGCPIKGNPAGDFVYQIKFGDGSGYCIGTDANGNALATACNGPDGYGGGNGTLEVADSDGGYCPSGTNNAINVYWSNKNGGWTSSGVRGISWAQGNGNQVVLDNWQNIWCLGYYSY